MNSELSDGGNVASLSVPKPSDKLTTHHRFLTALVIGLLLAACAAAFMPYCFAPHYRASAVLQFTETAPFLAYASDPDRRSAERYVQTQVELLRSDMVLEPALGRPEIARLTELAGVINRVGHLRDLIEFSRVGDSELYTLSYTSRSAEDAAKVVNAIINEYMSSHASDDSQRTQQVVSILDEERRRRGLEVERLRKRVLELSSEATGRNPFDPAGAPSSNPDSKQLTNLNDRLIDIEADEELCKAELQFSLDHPDPIERSNNTSDTVDSQIAARPEIHGWQVTIEENESFVNQIKVSDAKWSDNPNYVRLDKNAQSQRSALNKHKHELHEQLVAEESHKGSLGSDQSVLALKRQLDLLATKKRILSQRIDELVKRQRYQPAKIVELEFARAELAREDKVFESIASRKMALQTELRAPARVQLRHSADVPLEPVTERHFGWLAIVCSAAFVVPFAALLALRPSKQSLDIGPARE